VHLVIQHSKRMLRQNENAPSEGNAVQILWCNSNCSHNEARHVAMLIVIASKIANWMCVSSLTYKSTELPPLSTQQFAWYKNIAVCNKKYYYRCKIYSQLCKTAWLRAGSFFIRARAPITMDFHQMFALETRTKRKRSFAESCSNFIT